MQNGNSEQVQMIRQAIRKGGTEDLAEIIEIVQACGAIDYTNQKAREHVDAAQNAIRVLSDTPAKQALNALAELALSRNS
jgi:octaprenyl-diphosphate synthase